VPDARSTRSTDRRVQKTRALLHGALASLIHEKGYDAIAVKEILARADVGRSTFYAHFRGKDELLERGIRDTVLRAGETSASGRSSGSAADRVLRFSLPIFEHVEQHIERHGRASDASIDARGQAVVHDHLERVLVELVGHELGRLGQRHQRGGPEVPCDLLARHVALTFLLVLNWWAGSEEPLPAQTANDLFRALVLPAVTDALGS
jgi:AcrR family transcriptional regulator